MTSKESGSTSKPKLSKEDEIFIKHDEQIRNLRMHYLKASAQVTPEDFDDLEDFGRDEFSEDAIMYPVTLGETKVPDFDKVYEQLGENPHTALCLADFEGLDPLGGVNDEKSLRKLAAYELLSPYNDIKSRKIAQETLFGEVVVREYFKYLAPSGASLAIMVDKKNRIWVELNSAFKSFGTEVDDYLDRMPDFYHNHMITQSYIDLRSMSRKLVPVDAVFMGDMVFNHYVLEFLAPSDQKWVMRELLPKVRAQAYAAMLYKDSPVQALFEIAQETMRAELDYKDVVIGMAKETIAKQNTRLQRMQDYYGLMSNEIIKMRTELAKAYEKKAKRRVIRYEPNVVYDKDGNPVLVPKQFIPANVSLVPGEEGVYEGFDLGVHMTDGKFIDVVASHLQDFESPYYDDQVVLIDYLLEDLSVVHMGLNFHSLSVMLGTLGIERFCRAEFPSVRWAEDGETGRKSSKQRTLYCLKGFAKPVDYMRERIRSFGARPEFDPATSSSILHEKEYLEGELADAHTEKMVERQRAAEQRAKRRDDVDNGLDIPDFNNWDIDDII